MPLCKSEDAQVAQEVTQPMGVGPGPFSWLTLRAEGPKVIGQMHREGREAGHRAELPGHVLAKKTGKSSPEAPSGRSRLCFLERWAEVREHLLLACSAGAAASPAGPKGPLSLASSPSCILQDHPCPTFFSAKTCLPLLLPPYHPTRGHILSHPSVPVP